MMSHDLLLQTAYSQRALFLPRELSFSEYPAFPVWNAMKCGQPSNEMLLTILKFLSFHRMYLHVTIKRIEHN